MLGIYLFGLFIAGVVIAVVALIGLFICATDGENPIEILSDEDVASLIGLVFLGVLLWPGLVAALAVVIVGALPAYLVWASWQAIKTYGFERQWMR